jgi:uncharacterized membrane protein (UPF0127 family)
MAIGMTSVSGMEVVRRLRLAPLLALWLALLFAAPAAAQALEPLTLVTASGEHKFEVEIAKTVDQRAKGLMYRRFMPEDRGMLFEFETNAPVAFWMENTYISLDMVFISPDGTVTHIAANAEPLSQAVIPSGGPCIGVLEINAGVAAKIGLAVGDKVRAAFFHS